MKGREGRFFALLYLLMFPVLEVLAQKAPLLDHLAKIDLQWTASHPYLLEHSFEQFYQAGTTYGYGYGAFRPAFVDKKHSTLGFHTASQKSIAEWRFQGDFHYRKILQKQIPFLLQNQASPHNPFTLADGSLGNWTGDHIDFSISGLSPLWKGRFRTHTILRYGVGSNNRNTEPRPLNRYSTLHLEIGNSIALHPYIKIGLAGFVEQSQEENNLGAFAVQDFSLYQLRGLSTFTRNTFQAFQRNQTENILGGKLFSTFANGTDWGFIELSSSSSLFEARDGIAYPLEAGRVELTQHSFRTGYHKPFSKGRTLRFGTSWNKRSSVAIDPIFKAINFDFSQDIAKVYSSVFFQDQILRQLGLHFTYHSERRGETAGKDFLTFTNLQSNLVTDVSIALSENSTLWVKPILGYRTNLESGAEINDVGLLKEIFDLEINYYRSQAVWAQLQVNWITPIQGNNLNIGMDISSERTSQTFYNRLSIKMELLF